MFFGKTFTTFIPSSGAKSLAELLETEQPITKLIIFRNNGNFALGGSDVTESNYGLVVGSSTSPTVLDFDCKDNAINDLFVVAFGAGDHELHIFAY